jgi:hypothetical protein
MTDSSDYHHMSPQGAARFTTLLATALETRVTGLFGRGAAAVVATRQG